MALNQTLAQLRANLRRFANIGGSTALIRHPNADLNEYINRGLASLHRRLMEVVPDQRWLATHTFPTVAGTTLYSLPAGFETLLSVEVLGDGRRTWIEAYNLNERAALTDDSTTGRPYTYRLRPAHIDVLPTPDAAYDVAIYYVPNAVQMAIDADTFDTIARLDEYVIAFAARLVGVKDRAGDLLQIADAQMESIKADIASLARSKDKNSPSRVIDESFAPRIFRRWVR